ncbi:C-terminal binding protein [bacterium LRH843]|nr:C-terminal binding protein [bacterium LRH843]
MVITDSDHPNINPELDAIKESDCIIRLEQCVTEEDVIEKCQDADGIINQYVPLTKNVLQSLPNCQVIAKYGVGYDNVDVNAAAELGIQVCNVPDYGVEEVSDHAIALTFNIVRKINLLSNAVKDNHWDFQIAAPIRRLSKMTVGVVGLGRTGQAYASKAAALGWNVIGYHRAKLDLDIKQVSLEELCQVSDVISLHIPLNEETHHLFNERLFKLMKPSAFIVNTARGGVLNEDDLIHALENKTIAGAALDVLQMEPPEIDHKLFQFDQVIITPHAAFYSEESYYDMKRKAAEEVITFLQSKQIRYPVNEPMAWNR